MSKHVVWRNKLINVCQNTLYGGTDSLMYVKTHCMKEQNLLMCVKTRCMKEQTY